MCFSTEASFTASILLGGIGIATLKQTRSRAQTLFALIPFLFAIQQFCEGVLWMALNQGLHPVWWSRFAEYTFLFFAFLTWPIIFPLAFWSMEESPSRRLALLFCLGMGALFVAGHLIAIQGHALSVTIINHSLQYGAYKTSSVALDYGIKAIYLLATVVPCFVSTYPKAWFFGLCTAFAFVVAQFFYEATFSSVWCFFAAIVSSMIFALLRNYNPLPKNQKRW